LQNVSNMFSGVVVNEKSPIVEFEDPTKIQDEFPKVGNLPNLEDVLLFIQQSHLAIDQSIRGQVEDTIRACYRSIIDRKINCTFLRNLTICKAEQHVSIPGPKLHSKESNRYMTLAWGLGIDTKDLYHGGQDFVVWINFWVEFWKSLCRSWVSLKIWGKEVGSRHGTMSLTCKLTGWEIGFWSNVF